VRETKRCLVYCYYRARAFVPTMAAAVHAGHASANARCLYSRVTTAAVTGSAGLACVSISCSWNTPTPASGNPLSLLGSIAPRWGREKATHQQPFLPVPCATIEDGSGAMQRPLAVSSYSRHPSLVSR